MLGPEYQDIQVPSQTSAPSLPLHIAALFIGNYRLPINNEPWKYQLDFEQGC
jgi:hypothetical protein